MRARPSDARRMPSQQAVRLPQALPAVPVELHDAAVVHIWASTGRRAAGGRASGRQHGPAWAPPRSAPCNTPAGAPETDAYRRPPSPSGLNDTPDSSPNRSTTWLSWYLRPGGGGGGRSLWGAWQGTGAVLWPPPAQACSRQGRGRRARRRARSGRQREEACVRACGARKAGQGRARLLTRRLHHIATHSLPAQPPQGSGRRGCSRPGQARRGRRSGAGVRRNATQRGTGGPPRRGQQGARQGRKLCLYEGPRA